jgi:hypothetical protein
MCGDDLGAAVCQLGDEMQVPHQEPRVRVGDRLLMPPTDSLTARFTWCPSTRVLRRPATVIERVKILANYLRERRAAYLTLS